MSDQPETTPKPQAVSIALLPVPAGPLFSEVTMRIRPSSPQGLPQLLRMILQAHSKQLREQRRDTKQNCSQKTHQYSLLVFVSMPQPTTLIMWLVCLVLVPEKMPPV